MLDTFVFFRYLVIVWIGVAFCLWAFRPMIHDFAARAAWLSLFFLFLLMYAPVLAFVQSRGLPLDQYSGTVATGFTVGAISLTTAITRPWRVKRRDSLPLNVTAAVMLGLSLSRWLFAANPMTPANWRRPADMIIQSVSARPQSRQLPDIYYIVLDGMGSPGLLRQDYGVDLGPFVAFLRSEGFHVPEDARSNYAQTYLSLASTLNMTYLDPIVKELGPDSRDRRPLSYLIQRNALMKLGRQAGYRTIVIGSDYQATETIAEADVCLCPRYGLDEIEQSAMALTPLAAVPRDRWTFGAHRRKVLSAFSAIEDAAVAPGPKFVFAHIVAPHPPFLFGPDGASRRPLTAKAFAFADGGLFPGTSHEYRAGYGDQARFIANRTRETIESLLRRGGADAVIIVHGDHGPALHLLADSEDLTKVGSRFEIFAAYRFPGEPPELDPILSPLNGARALATTYFGVSMPSLPDRSFFSPWARPYDLEEIDAIQLR